MKHVEPTLGSPTGGVTWPAGRGGSTAGEEVWRRKTTWSSSPLSDSGTIGTGLKKAEMGGRVGCGGGSG